jgi:hypothetical protein
MISILFCTLVLVNVFDQCISIFNRCFPIIHMIFYRPIFVQSISIDEYGAVKNINNWKAAVKNTNALIKAIYSADSSTTDNLVLFPKGNIYYLTNCSFDGLTDINIQVDGKIIYSDEISNYGYSHNSIQLTK